MVRYLTSLICFQIFHICQTTSDLPEYALIQEMAKIEVRRAASCVSEEAEPVEKAPGQNSLGSVSHKNLEESEIETGL